MKVHKYYRWRALEIWEDYEENEFIGELIFGFERVKCPLWKISYKKLFSCYEISEVGLEGLKEGLMKLTKIEKVVLEFSG